MKKTNYQSQNIFNLNTCLFINALAGITEDQARDRISGHNNSINWIAAHTVWAGYNTLIFLNKPVNNPYLSLFVNFKPYDETADYPSLGEIKKEWRNCPALLKDALDSVTENHLAAPSPFKSPVEDYTNRGTISFFAQYESYDIGQPGLLKKYFTKEAMAYI